jgi:hypothetical protein
MSDFTAINDAIKKQYGFDDWGKTIVTNVAARSTVNIPSLQTSDKFELERRVELPEDRPGFRAYIEYYKCRSDPETRFAATILQNQTVEQAHEELAEELSKSMAPSLPRAEEKNIHVGHIAFAGHGTIQTAVKFVRRNVFVKVESVGTRQADVKDLAESIDQHIVSNPGE